MPYKTRKVKGGVRVVNAATGKVHAKATTPTNAASQLRLLNAVDHGWTPTGKTPRQKIQHGLSQERKHGRKHTKRR